MTHALFVLLAIVVLAPVLGYLPMPSLAAMLLVVAWNMAEVRHVVHTVRTSPRSDVLVLLTCLVLTVLFDMVIAVSVGFVLASILFMRRMIEVSGVELTRLPGTEVSVVVFDLRRVPAIDATGLVNLRSALDRLGSRGIFAVLAGVQAQPHAALERAHLHDRPGAFRVFTDFDEALKAAGEIAATRTKPHAAR